MDAEMPRPAGWGPSRAGLDDFRVTAESGPSINPTTLRRQAQGRLRREHLARQIHRLGARVLFELVEEIGRHHGIADDIDGRLERYAGLDPVVLHTAGGDVFPAVPMRVVGGAQ